MKARKNKDYNMKWNNDEKSDSEFSDGELD